MKKAGLLFFICSMLICLQATAKNLVSWPDFMSKQDLTWGKLPQAWDEAPFMGNGTLGTYICREPGTNTIRIEVCNSFVHDYRHDDRGIYGRGRLLIGHFLIKPVGNIESGSMRLHLWDAQATADITTSKGKIHLKSYVASGTPYIIVEAEANDGEKQFQWEFVPAKADSPRQLNAIAKNHKNHFRKDYVSNPSHELGKGNGIPYCHQPLKDGGSTTTAWKVIKAPSRQILIATCEHSHPTDTSKKRALENVKAVTDTSALQAIEQKHKEWWHTYYPKSFVSLPDKRIENFYWIQLYKLAAATHPDGAIIDNCGPWLVPTPWPNAWWNLNVQLTYWPIYASNHTDLGNPLVKAFHDNQKNLIGNIVRQYQDDASGIPVATGFDLAGTYVGVPGKGNKAQIGLLPWICHNLWLQYRYTMDESILRETVYALLKRAVNYYRHFIYADTNGTLHLPATYSPEYGSAPDCNFDLALLRWGCRTLLESARILHINDELIPEWQRILRNLADFPRDSTGITIGAGVPYEKSHRHYSHLLMFYPLYLLNSDQPGTKELLEKSIDHWFSLPKNILGFSLTGAASMYASYGEGDKALEQLNKLFTKHLRPNTMYKESGPVIETPLSGAQVVNDMLLQSWGGKIRVFPGVPEAWKDVTFENMRAEGAFLVSAVRKDGKTVYIRIQSTTGSPFILKTDMANPTIKEGKGTLRVLDDNTLSISLAKGGSITLTPANGNLQDIAEVRGQGSNFFGLH